MIYLENITTVQTVLIQTNWPIGQTSVSLEIRSTVSGETVLEQTIPVEQEGGYIKASISLPAGLNAGEYAYGIRHETQVYASGLCQIGTYSRPITQGEGGFILKQAK